MKTAGFVSFSLKYFQPIWIRFIHQFSFQIYTHDLLLNSTFRWYFRRIKRIEAEKKLLLPENDHGAFLIRDSESRHNDYSLSGKKNAAHFMLEFHKYFLVFFVKLNKILKLFSIQ